MAKFIDITGEKFGRLTVVERAENNKFGDAQWLCKCECGTEKAVTGYKLRNGHTKSCGCLSVDMGKERATHGNSTHPLYRVWRNLKTRCLNPKYWKTHRYGKRGISICDEWIDDFQAFFDFCMANGWRPELQIDRIDNDGNYEPDNCHFVTPAENSRNRSTTKLTEGKAYLIREMHKTGKFFQRDIGKAVGFSQTQIGRIIRGETWR